MSESRYILIYPFESRELAFKLANDIDGQLMWQNSTAYPIDNIPAFIIPVAEFSGRWTAPNRIEDLEQQLSSAQERIKELEMEGGLKELHLKGECPASCGYCAYEAGQQETIDHLCDALLEAANDIRKAFQDDSVIEFHENKYRALVAEIKGK